MKLTITTLSEDIITLDVSGDMEIENFKALCEFEINVSASQFVVVWNGRPITDNKAKLVDLGIKDGDMIFIQPMQIPNQRTQPNQSAPAGMSIDFGAIQIPGTSGQSPSSQGRNSQSGRRRTEMPDDPAAIRQALLNSPHDLALLKERNPTLADALLSGDLERFTEVLRQQQKERSEREMQRIRMANADPFDADAQRQIAEEIRQKNVDANMETAMEFSPESFGQVVMLYIDCHVNGHPVKAFVDSGAQMTIMSQACAERCNIMRLVDRRWAGIAKGVGTQKIIGRVHLCNIQIEDQHFASTFSILEDQPMDMLLGLDMLKRHQCVIDLKENSLLIGTTNTKTRFLPESDLPEHARLNRSESATSADDDAQLAQALARSAEENTNQSGTSSAATGAAQFPEDVIAKLTAHGFSRQDALQELTRAHGDVDQALAALFARSLSVPT